MDTSAEARARWLFGAFLLVLAAAAAGWFLLAAARSTTYEVRTRDPVSGLIPGAPVEFHGVEVGKVRSVDLLEPRLVRVLLEVRRDVPVSSVTVATITGRGLATRGFTGYVYVALEDGPGPGVPLTAPADGRYPRLAAGPARQVNIDTAVARMNENVQAVTALLQSALDPQTLAALRQSLANLERLTQALAGQEGRLATILANAERASVQVQPLLRSSGEAVHTVQAELLPQAQATLARLDTLSASVDQRLGVILRNTEQASTQFVPLLQASNEAVRSLQTQVLPQAQRTLVRLDHLSGTLDDAAGRIRRNPALLLRGGSPVPAGPGENP